MISRLIYRTVFIGGIIAIFTSLLLFTFNWRFPALVSSLISMWLLWGALVIRIEFKVKGFKPFRWLIKKTKNASKPAPRNRKERRHGRQN